MSQSSVQQCMQKFIEAFDERFRFRGGAGYREIRAVESLLGVELPPELIEMLIAANGQLRGLRDGTTSDMFFPQLRTGSSEFDETLGSGFLCSLEEMLLETLMLRESYQRMEQDGTDWLAYAAAFRTHGPVAVNQSLLVLATSWCNPSLIGLDLQPAAGGQVGQVVALCEQPCTATVLAPSLGAFLEQLWLGYSTGRYELVTTQERRYWAETAV